MKLGFGVLGVLCVSTIAVHAAPEKALTAPSFSASPKDLLSIASKETANDVPVVILRKENQYAIDARGRAVSRFRMIYVVRTAAGIDDWGTLSTTYRPFYQDKPALRGRVIEPSGTVSNLDPTLIHDAPSVSSSPTVYSDTRDIQGPLPRLQVGSVVEVEIETVDRVPLLEAGTIERFTYGSSVPTNSASLVITAPASRKAIVMARKLPVRPKRTVANGIETWVFDFGRMPAFDDDESSLPSDVIEYPYVGVATGASWTAIARDYKKIIEKRLTDGPVTLPPALKGKPTIDTVHGIVAWLHAQIRYTGIEFGEASITPWPPAETVKRGFGDCKDKATLLVALLRQAGFRADLALLWTGPSQDIDPQLPGMGEFDHAIVRAIVDGKPVWIDATEDLHRAGTLPLRDQGRRALIVADDTRDLVLTPRLTSADSIVREVRTWQLSELGGAKVTEVSTETGLFDTTNRTWIRDSRADKVREDLQEYARAEYRGELESYTTTSPADLTKPFEMTTVVAKAERGWTTRSKIDVFLFPADTLAKTPEDFRKFDAKEPPRKNDFEVWRPHRYEIENRFVLPPGFTAPTPVAERTTVLGTATFVERQRLDGKTFVVTFTFDSGKSRLTPLELSSITKALTELNKESRRISFPQTGWALADAGKLKEAVTSLEELINAHPKEAIHYTQLARAYLVAGAGQAARRAAKKAVELEPKNADAFAMLGYVLRKDSFGRELGFDSDRAGAIAAYKKSLELDPEMEWAAGDIATLLEVGPTGRAAGADLPGAIKAYELVVRLDPSDNENAVRLAKLLVRANRSAEAVKLLRPRSGDERDKLLLVAIASSQGGPAAIAESSQLRSAPTALAGAAGLLLSLRQYDLARELFAATGNSNNPYAQIWNRAKKRPTTLNRKDPSTVVHQMFAEMMFPDQPSTVFWDDTTRESLTKSNAIPSNLVEQLGQLGDDFWPDLSYSVFDVTVDGAKAGPWRAEFDAMGRHAGVYLALDRGEVKIIGLQGEIEGLGRHAQRIARDEAGVLRLLDWARAEVDAKQAKAAWFVKVWGPNLPRDANARAVAAAVLAGSKGDRAVLDRCASSAAEARIACDTMIGYQLADQQKWAELEKHASTSKAGEEEKSYWRAFALIRLKKFDDASTATDALPGDAAPFARMLRVEIALGRGKVDDAIQLLEDGLKQLGALGASKNNLAWLRLVHHKDLARAFELARQAVDEAKEDPNSAHTLATVAAERGDVSTAVRHAVSAMTMRNRRVPTGSDWLVFGVIFEKLGLRDDAIAAYRRVTAEPNAGTTFHPASLDIAKANLARMGAK